MKINAQSLKQLGLVGLAAVVLGVAGCKSTGDRTPRQVMNDKITAHQVKRALAKAPVFKYPDVNANVYHGMVQLTGFVDTPEQREQAAQIAAQVKGVNEVINQIMIKTMPAGRATIRDPLGQETGRIMLDTNAPPPKPLRVQPPQTTPATPTPDGNKNP